MCRVRLRRAVEGGLYEHTQPYIRAALMMGLFLCLLRGALGTSGSAVSNSGRSHCFFSWGGGGGEEEEPGQVLLSRFRRTTHAFKHHHFLCYILYIKQWKPIMLSR